MRSLGRLILVAVSCVACGSEQSPVAGPTTPSATATPPAPHDEVEVASVPALPSPTVSASSDPGPAIAAADARPPECRCDILDLESNGPAKSRCTWVQGEDGTVSVTAETSPKFTAKLTPGPPRGGKADPGFDGEFDFACKQRWCGQQQLRVHPAGENEYRVTVERSAEGPPKRVLWLSCKP